MRVIKTIFAFACLTLSASAQMATTNTQQISLQEAIQRALRHNLDLQIERYTPQISLYALGVAYAGYDPTFTASGKHDYIVSGGGLDAENRTVPPSTSDADGFNTSLGGLLPWGFTYSLQGNITDTYGQSSFFDSSSNLMSRAFENTRGAAFINMTQPLLRNFWFNSTRLNIAVAKNRVKFSELGLKQQIINVVTDVEKAYYDLIFAQENVKVQEQALGLADRLFQENQKRVEVGVLAPLDEKQAGSQVAARRADLLTAQGTLETQENAFKKLITDNYSEVHDVFLQPSETLSAPKQLFDVQDSWSKGLTARPDLLQAKLDLERAGIEVRYYRNQVYPQLDLFGTYGQSGSAREFSGALGNIQDGTRPFYTYGALFSIPLSNKAARTRYRSGKATAEQVVLEVKRLEQTIMISIDDAVKQAQVAYQQVDATHQARLYAEAALDAEQRKLESGKSTSFVVLQLQRDLTAGRSEEIRALANYNKALAEIAKQEATTLERNKIDINGK